MKMTVEDLEVQQNCWFRSDSQQRSEMSVCVCVCVFMQLYLSGISCFQKRPQRSPPSVDPPKRPTTAKNIDKPHTHTHTPLYF